MYTMRYGDSEISFPLPAGEVQDILLPHALEQACDTPEKLVEQAFAAPVGAPPLEQVVHAGDTVCIIISDITRSWQPTSQYLPFVIRRLNEIGVPDRDIRILSANGTHRRQTPEEHLALLGEALYRRFQVIDHQCDEKEHLTYVGTTRRGTPVYLNSTALESDKLILTGGVTCHSMAGYGGGRKSVKAFAGDWVQAHRAATELVDQLDSVSVRARCDYAIVSAGGAPKDINLYQSSKALANVSQMVKPGGTIVMMAECPEGFGDPDCARQITEFKTMAERETALRANFTIGGFMGYLFTLTAERFRFILVSQIPREQFANAKILLAAGMEEALALADAGGYDPRRSIALMPEGSKTMPKFTDAPC